MTNRCHLAFGILYLGGISMIESRCGIRCSECRYKEEFNCKGCISISKPFWGESCPIKSCCESKGYKFCGECSEFPCNILVGFSYDKEQGDNGKRIETCRCWKNV